MPGWERVAGGKVALVGGLRVGEVLGSDIFSIIAGTVSVNPGSIGATSRGAITATVAGLRVGDHVVLSPPAALNDDLLYVGCRVTADDELTIYLYNPTVAPIDDAAATWDYLWFNLTES